MPSAMAPDRGYIASRFSIVELPAPVERYSIYRYTKFTLNGRRFSGLFRISGNSVLVVLHRDPIRITSVWEFPVL